MHLTAPQVLATFAAVGREITPDRAEAVAAAVTCCGLEFAIGSGEPVGELYGDLLSFKAALAEERDPNLIVARLKREARDLDAQEEIVRDEVAVFWGKAAYRQRQGEEFLAASFRKRAEAAERTADRLMLGGVRARLHAASIEAGLVNGAALMSVVA